MTFIHRGLACTLAVFVASACHGKNAEDVVARDSTLAERAPRGTLYWNIDKSGSTELVIKNPSGEVVKSGVTGQLSFEPLGGVDPEVSLEAKGDTGVWLADGPDLDDELTLVNYALIVNGQPMTGSLHLPHAGTKGLVESAKLNVSASVAAVHGGTVQVLGNNRFEVVGDATSAQTRVYLLGDVTARPKHVRLAVAAERPDLVELEWDPDGYYVADFRVERPRTVTLVVVDASDDVHVALVGYRPGVVIAVDAAPVFWVRRDWGPPGLARGHYKGTPWGPPGHGGVHFHGHEGREGHEGHEGREGKGGKIMIKVH